MKYVLLILCIYTLLFISYIETYLCIWNKSVLILFTSHPVHLYLLNKVNRLLMDTVMFV